MSPTKTFTDSPPNVTLTRHHQVDGCWINDDPNASVVVIRCHGDAESRRVGFPQSGYVMRAGWWTEESEFVDTWWVKTLTEAEATALVMLTTRDDEPRGARLMCMCLNEACAYCRVGVVPFVFDTDADDWACPKCGAIA